VLFCIEVLQESWIFFFAPVFLALFSDHFGQVALRVYECIAASVSKFEVLQPTLPPLPFFFLLLFDELLQTVENDRGNLIVPTEWWDDN
jgi:hypothetical protein